jgi:hypothetical protein
MKGRYVEGASQAGRRFNAVPLQNAILCAECEVVSDSPHDACLICGSSSLFNIAHIFGGNLKLVRRCTQSWQPTTKWRNEGQEWGNGNVRNAAGRKR